jgi:hypothetical protein
MRFLSYETQVARSGVRVLVRKLTDSAVLIRGEQLWCERGRKGNRISPHVIMVCAHILLTAPSNSMRSVR